MNLSWKILFVIILIPLYTQFVSAQFSTFTKNDIKEVLIIQGYTDLVEIQVMSDNIYNKYLDKISFRFNDFTSSFGYSALSGISLGAYESNTFWGYNEIEWMPEFMQKWYLASQDHFSGKPNYHFISWQFFFREMDYVTDRLAFDNWMKFYRQKWYWAIITHWVVKNIAATITRDTFLHNKPFFSFDIGLLFR